MSTSGSKSNEHVAHFLVDIHSSLPMLPSPAAEDIPMLKSEAAPLHLPSSSASLKPRCIFDAAHGKIGI